MIRTFTIAAALATMPISAWAEDVPGPKEVVTAIYETFRPGVPKADPSVHYSKRLAAIAEQSAENAIQTSTQAMSGEAFSADITFNPFVPDHAALLHDLSISEPTTVDDRSVVSVRFHNFDFPRLLTISLMQEDGEWKVDDVASFGEERPWLLSWALTTDPYAY